MATESDLQRCDWGRAPEIYVDYHDTEWGVPQYDDQRLFEKLCLEGAQAGLSWLTVLKKREHYRKVFDQFDATKMVRYKAKKIDRLLADPGIIRNNLKVNAFIKNARCYLDLVSELGSFSDYVWGFVDGEPITNHFHSKDEVPVTTAVSDAMSKDLKKRGFTFVGSTICYAYMQSMGLVNDHLTCCFRHRELKK